MMSVLHWTELVVSFYILVVNTMSVFTTMIVLQWPSILGGIFNGNSVENRF